MIYVGPRRLNRLVIHSWGTSHSLLLDVAKEAYCPHGLKGPGLEGKTMQRMAVDQDITESLSLFLPLETTPPLDSIPRESGFSPLCKLV